MKKLSTTLFLIIGCIGTISATYKGFVYNKTKEHPLVNVVITDGKNVTKTNIYGEYSLPGYEKTRFITVTTPAGYSIDQYYIPVNKNIDSYDFNLKINNQTKNRIHSFIQITDTEINGSGVGIWASYLKEYIQNEHPAFLVHTGDICYDNGLRMHKKVVNTLTIGCPTYYGIGNHDLTKGQYGEELFESIYGPTWYSFDVGDTHYVMTPMANGDYDPGYTKQEVYQWLKNDLSMMRKDQSLVVFNHDLLTTGNDFIFGINDKESINLRQYNLKAWVYGHMHYDYVRNQNGVYAICTGTIDKGGIDHSPSAFRVISIDKDNNVSTQLRYAFIKPETSIASPRDNQPSPLTEFDKLPISVNTYNSVANTKRVLYTLYEADNKKEIQHGEITQQLTDWNWYKEINLPNNLDRKRIAINVQAQYTNNQTSSATNIFIYNAKNKPIIKLGDDWNTLLKNAQHDGNNITFNKNFNQLAWINNVGANIFMSSPIIANQKVIVGSVDDEANNKSSISAFDAQNGKLIWKFSTINSIKNSMAYENGIIAALDASAQLYTIDIQTGRLLWKKQLELETFPYSAEGIAINKGIIYAGAGKGLSAYDLKTGNRIWKNTDWEKNETATTTITIADNVLISASQWSGLYANDIQSGKMLWKITDKGMSDRGSTPIYEQGKLYIISRKSLFIINPQTGEIERQKDLSANLDVTSTPLITEYSIIFGSANKGVIALDKNTLNIKWNFQTNSSMIFTAPYSTTPDAGLETSIVAIGNKLYFGASDGYFYILDKETGFLEESLYMGTPIFSTVAQSGNLMIFTDYSGNIYGITSL